MNLTSTQLPAHLAARAQAFQWILTALDILDLTETTITAHYDGGWSIHTRAGEQTARMLLDILAGELIFDAATGPDDWSTVVTVRDYPDAFSGFTTYRAGPYTVHGALRPMARETVA